MYKYSILYNTFINDGKDDDDFDERGILKDGGRLRVPAMMMDHDTVGGDSDRSREAYDSAKGELGARWKGGLQDGDTFRLGDRMVTVARRNPENGKLQLRDASTATDTETLKQSAYDSYDSEIQSRYLHTYDAKAGEACLTAGRERGVWRERADGRLACVPGDKSSKENELAGPLSDSEQVQVRDQMYSDYDSEVSNAWRK